MSSNFKESIKTMDFKTILIIIFFSISMIFGYQWYFSLDDKREYKSKLNELKEENDRIVESRDSIKLNLELIESRYDSIESLNVGLQAEIDVLRLDISKSKAKVVFNEKELNNIKEKSEKNKKEIEDLRNSTSTKTEEELLNSIKNKL